jgi:hypothetical protein
MNPSFEPADWETAALLPARLLAGAPSAVRQKVRRVERCLYLLILEQLKPEPGAPALAHEVRALVEELAIVARALRDLDGLEAVAGALDAVLRETRPSLEALGTLSNADSEPPAAERGIRPFAFQLSRDPLFRNTAQALGDFLVSLQIESGRAERLAALYQDLLWIRAVLQHHIARRGEISCLRHGDSVLCAAAGALAARLEAPLEELRQAVETSEAAA